MCRVVEESNLCVVRLTGPSNNAFDLRRKRILCGDADRFFSRAVGLARIVMSRWRLFTNEKTSEFSFRRACAKPSTHQQPTHPLLQTRVRDSTNLNEFLSLGRSGRIDPTTTSDSREDLYCDIHFRPFAERSVQIRRQSPRFGWPRKRRSFLLL